MSNRKSQRRQTSAVHLALRAREFVRGYRAPIAGIVALALLLAVLGAADPLVMKYLFDALTAGKASALPMAIGALLAIEAGRAGLTRVLSVLTWNVRVGVDFHMRERLVAKLHALPMEYHSRAGVGGTINKLNQSISSFVGAFGEITFNVLPSLVYL